METITKLNDEQLEVKQEIVSILSKPNLERMQSQLIAKKAELDEQLEKINEYLIKFDK